jgi:hypothetical protein
MLCFTHTIYTEKVRSTVAQLYCYVPDPIALRVEQNAQTAGLSVSRYLSELVKRTVAPEWPEHYFEQVVGGWAGEILERPVQLPFEQRDDLLETIRNE